MKRIWTKISLFLLGVLAASGIYSADVKAFQHTKIMANEVNETTPLYLSPASDLFTEEIGTSWHYSHGSHESHWSHASHRSSW